MGSFGKEIHFMLKNQVEGRNRGFGIRIKPIQQVFYINAEFDLRDAII